MITQNGRLINLSQSFERRSGPLRMFTSNAMFTML